MLRTVIVALPRASALALIFKVPAFSVGPCVISCQMFVKSEFPLDSALACDSDQQKCGWHFFRNL